MKTKAESLAARVKRLRDDRGYKQDDLAVASGIKQQTISDIEAGRTTNPRLDTLLALARALEISVSELIDA